MDILVDYDNILPTLRAKGLRYTAERILTAIPERLLPDGSRCRLRLYGGWYEQKSLTRRAQALSTEIQTSFPSPLVLISQAQARRLITMAELAYSTESVPQHHLFHTYR